jgi:hypothetical protein
VRKPPILSNLSLYHNVNLYTYNSKFYGRVRQDLEEGQIVNITIENKFNNYR